MTAEIDKQKIEIKFLDPRLEKFFNAQLPVPFSTPGRYVSTDITDADGHWFVIFFEPQRNENGPYYQQIGSLNYNPNADELAKDDFIMREFQFERTNK